MSLLGQWPPVITGQTFEILDTLHRENFMQYRVRFYWTPNEQTEGYLLVPDKEGKKPAVITTFYEPETAIGLGGKPYRDFAYQLTKRGFVTLSIGTTKTTENQTYSIYYPPLKMPTLQPLSALAYAAANAWEVLAKVQDVDSTRIGTQGILMVGSGQCLPHAYTKSSLVRHGETPELYSTKQKRDISITGNPGIWDIIRHHGKIHGVKMGMIMLKAFIRSSAKKDMICMNCIR